MAKEVAMSNPWLQRWRKGQTGWHEPDGNKNLKQHWDVDEGRVLVPLCGKSPDLLWLEARGNEVVGVELSKIAATEFFDDNGLAYESQRDGAMTRYIATERNIVIVCGDYFEFTDASKFDACYDRGSLIALPDSVRPDYVAHTNALLGPDACQLLITVEYDQSAADGPPYSVESEEVLSYWPDLKRIDEGDDIDNAPPKFKQAGLSRMLEVAWRR
jgi:thiopurine S-methyltransferase